MLSKFNLQMKLDLITIDSQGNIKQEDYDRFNELIKDETNSVLLHFHSSKCELYIDLFAWKGKVGGTAATFTIQGSRNTLSE